jgi:hypothetical protein
VAIDTSGNYIVAAGDLVEVTPGGVVTTIATGLSTLWGVAVESRLPEPVGGVILPANKLAVLVPRLALLGLAATALVILKRRR